MTENDFISKGNGIRTGGDLGEGAGFVLLSIGGGRRQLLWDCMASIRRHYLHAPIHVISDAPIGHEYKVTSTLVSVRDGHASRHYKTRLHEYTPFEVSVFVDDDTVIHRPFGAAAEWLGDANIAMVQDYGRRTLGRLLGWIKGNTPHREELKTIATKRPAAPYFNSGVMIFRQTADVAEMFDAWHAEWLRYQRTDQQPLVIVLDRLGTKVTVLPPLMNFITHHDGKGMAIPSMPGHILHFTNHKNTTPALYRQQMNIAAAKAPPAYLAFKRACDHGLCTKGQYQAIARVLLTAREWRPRFELLVFGCGHDSELWSLLNGVDGTRFIEDNDTWANLAGRGVERFAYPTRRGIEAEPSAHEIPDQLTEADWGMIIIDGPVGSGHNTPGRELPIVWAAKIRESNEAIVVVHDWDRPWERRLCDKYLGLPSATIAGDANRGGTLAAWFPADSDVREVALSAFYGA